MKQYIFKLNSNLPVCEGKVEIYEILTLLFYDGTGKC